MPPPHPQEGPHSCCYTMRAQWLRNLKGPRKPQQDSRASSETHILLLHVLARSPWRRLAEVMALVFVTATLWFLIAFWSPCAPLPEQTDLEFLEAKDDPAAIMTEEFYAGGGQVARRGLEHFPQLWCPAGSYSIYGQVRSKPGGRVRVRVRVY